MNYESFFNFKEKPFNQTPDPDFYFSSHSHKEAMQHLLYCIRSDDGFIEISGKSGTGKTLIIRSLLKQIAGENINVSFIVNSNSDPQDLVNAIALDFGLDSDLIAHHHGEQLLRLLYQRLTQLDDDNIIPLVIIDEAQNLSPEALEHLCLLSNLETEKKKLLKIVLVGQLELNKQLDIPIFQKIHNRITIRYQLKPLTMVEMDAYIQYRIRIASASESHIAVSPFPKKIIKNIYRYSNGIPRIVNTICDRALMAAFIDNKRTVTSFHVQKALRSLMGERTINSSRKTSPVRVIFLLLALMALLCFLFFQIQGKKLEKFSKTQIVQQQTPSSMPEKKDMHQPENHISKPQIQKSTYSAANNLTPTTMTTPDSLVVIFSPDVNRMVVWKGQMNLSFLNKTEPSIITQIDSGVYFLEKDFPVQCPKSSNKVNTFEEDKLVPVVASSIEYTSAQQLNLETIERPLTQTNTPSTQMIEKKFTLPQKQQKSTQPDETKKQMNTTTIKKPDPATQPNKDQSKSQDNDKKNSSSKKDNEVKLFPQEMLLVPEGDVVVVISPDINRLFVWKGTSVHPEFVHQEMFESSLEEGIYLLGKDRDDAPPFLFHTELTTNMSNQLIELLWKKVGSRSSNCIIPVLVSTSRKTISQRDIDDGKNIQLIVNKWVEAWQIKDFQQFMNLFNKKQILFYKINKPPIELAWEVLKSTQANIFSKKTQRIISASQPICLLDPKNPQNAIVVFNQMHSDNNYSESGVKAFFLMKSKNLGDQGGWVINGRLWVQGIRIMKTVH